MQLCKGGELHASFQDSDVGAFTYGDVGRIAVYMLVLADAMHSRGLVHCDLKPENFCLVEPLEAGKPLVDNLRLIDFGLSQRVRGGQAIAGLAGSIPYMAPEIKTRMYDHKVDIWSIGVIIYTLLNGTLPFDGRSAEEIMSRAATKQPDVSQLHPAVGDFVKWCASPSGRVASSFCFHATAQARWITSGPASEQWCNQRCAGDIVSCTSACIPSTVHARASVEK